MFTNSTNLGAHLEVHGYTVVLIPATDDYLVAAFDGVTVEVTCTGDTFTRAVVTGPGVNGTFDDVTAMLRHLSLPTGDPDADLAAAVEAWHRSLPPDPRRGPDGRIAGDLVEEGDVWVCNSVAQRGRTFRVTEVRNGHCYGVVLTNSDEVNRSLRRDAEARERGGLVGYTRDQVGAMVKIRLSRMRPTADGYYRQPSQEEVA